MNIVILASYVRNALCVGVSVFREVSYSLIYALFVLLICLVRGGTFVQIVLLYEKK